MRASAVIVQKGKVLLIHRKKEGKEYWVFPGGHIEAGETSEEAAIREIIKKTGLDCVSAKFTHDHQDENGELHPVFFCRVKEGELQIGGPEAERSSTDNWYNPEWVDLKDAMKLIIYPLTGYDLANQVT